MPVPAAAYTIKRNKLTARGTVHFPCPACAADLNAPLEEAGMQQHCPECGRPFAVPGVEDREADRQARAREEAEAERRKADAQAERERRQKAADEARRIHEINAARAVARAKEVAAAAIRKRPITHGFFILGSLLVIASVIGFIDGCQRNTSAMSDLTHQTRTEAKERHDA